MSSALENKNYDVLVGIESRGFIFASGLAYKLGKGLIPVRKPGKLPADTVQVTYQLEYGTDSLEMHSRTRSRPGQRVVIVDDVLATGGTARAVTELVEKVGGTVEATELLGGARFPQGTREAD